MLRKQKCGDAYFATKFPNESYEAFCERIPALTDSFELCSNFELYETYNNLFNQDLANISLKSTQEFHYFSIKKSDGNEKIVIPMSAKYEKFTFGFLLDIFEKFDTKIESFQLYVIGFDGTVSSYTVHDGIKEPEEKQKK